MRSSTPGAQYSHGKATRVTAISSVGKRGHRRCNTWLRATTASAIPTCQPNNAPQCAPLMKYNPLTCAKMSDKPTPAAKPCVTATGMKRAMRAKPLQAIRLCNKKPNAAKTPVIASACAAVMDAAAPASITKANMPPKSSATAVEGS
ncbi:MAG: hypothetical protein B7Y96_10750 [Comamonadaceae bacterium 32-67-11]|nr:MAG: hypothetical protein B7Y96_10750 [Comamonadaceae bacterium 32-67-11]